MLSLRSCFATAVFVSLPVLAQSNPPATATLQVNTQVVLLDVVVTDKSGNPVHGLMQKDFTVSENGKAQPLKSFAEHSGTNDKTVQISRQPEGVFSNERVTGSSGAVDVLLIDALNTPAPSQPYLRDQLVKFLTAERPGAHVAVFAMTTQLRMLQDFTTDPALLRLAVRAQGVKFSPLLQRELNDSAAHHESELMENMIESAGTPDMRAMLEDIQRTLLDMEARRASAQTQVRARETMEMLRQIGRYLAGIPGRKNLLWFSGSFPVHIQRDVQTTGDPFAGNADFGKEFQDTLALLARSQVAVYSVDARGLEAPPSTDSSEDGAIGNRQRTQNVYGTTAPNPRDSQFYIDQAAEHSTMRELSDATGGRAFYNTNGLAEASARAVRDGSEYYTLTYALPDPGTPGRRSIQVKMNTVTGVDLAYRRGYNVDQPGEKKQPEVESHRVALSEHVALTTPQATELLLRMQPQVSSPDPNRTVGAKLFGAEAGSATYRLNLAVRPDQLTFQPGPDGKTHVSVEFATVLYDAKGKMVDSHQDRADVALEGERLRAIQASSLRVHSTVTLPATGDWSVRLLVHDVPSDRVGTIQVSADAIRKFAVPSE